MHAIFIQTILELIKNKIKKKYFFIFPRNRDFESWTEYSRSGNVLGRIKIGQALSLKYVDFSLSQSPEVALHKFYLHLCHTGKIIHRKNSLSHDKNKHGEHMLLLFRFSYTVSVERKLLGEALWANYRR